MVLPVAIVVLPATVTALGAAALCAGLLRTPVGRSVGSTSGEGRRAYGGVPMTPTGGRSVTGGQGQEPSARGRYFTLQQAEAAFPVFTPRLLRRLVQERRIAFSRAGRCIVLAEADILAHLEANGAGWPAGTSLHDGLAEEAVRRLIWAARASTIALSRSAEACW